jgi:hypothetical protein
VLPLVSGAVFREVLPPCAGGGPCAPLPSIAQIASIAQIKGDARASRGIPGLSRASMVAALWMGRTIVGGEGRHGACALSTPQPAAFPIVLALVASRRCSDPTPPYTVRAIW